jgi:hypothetical protein
MCALIAFDHIARAKLITESDAATMSSASERGYPESVSFAWKSKENCLDKGQQCRLAGFVRTVEDHQAAVQRAKLVPRKMTEPVDR